LPAQTFLHLEALATKGAAVPRVAHEQRRGNDGPYRMAVDDGPGVAETIGVVEERLAFADAQLRVACRSHHDGAVELVAVEQEQVFDGDALLLHAGRRHPDAFGRAHRDAAPGPGDPAEPVELAAERDEERGNVFVRLHGRAHVAPSSSPPETTGGRMSCPSWASMPSATARRADNIARPLAMPRRSCQAPSIKPTPHRIAATGVATK